MHPLLHQVVPVVVIKRVDEKQIKSSVAITRKISRQSISITTRNYRFNNFMDLE